MTDHFEDEPQKIVSFRSWLKNHGAYVHPCLHFKAVASGFSITASNDIPPDIAAVICPFSVAITPEVSYRALSSILSEAEKSSPSVASWSERQLICTYLCMHHFFDVSNSPPVLAHRPYIDSLPSSDMLRTSLHFTAEELEAFRGSNLYGATLDRLQAWKSEWERCHAAISASSATWGTHFTWQAYLTASTYLSSRAFPSTLLSDNPSLVPTPTSHPILLPGIDALNHARAHPVSWVVTRPTSSETVAGQAQNGDLAISLVLHRPTPKGAELFNNYGPKPNAELILGYGFSLPNNPDDTIVLKVGGGHGAQPNKQKWEVGRNAQGAEPVWQAILSAVYACSEGQADHGEITVEDELCAADMLQEMVQNLLDRLPPSPSSAKSREVGGKMLRSEVAEMLEHYLEGQRDILQSLMHFAQQKEERAIVLARGQGLDIFDEDVEA